MLGERHLVSSLPGKALRTPVESKSRDSTSVLEVEPGKLDIRRREPVKIIYLSVYPFVTIKANFKLN